MTPCLRLIIACVLGLWIGNLSAKEREPLKVYILAGQSNMQGHAHVRTLEHIGMDPQTATLLDNIQREDGTARVHEDVWISYLSTGGEKQGRLTTGFGADENKIGPELTFGIHMQRLLDEPILIIKTAWGGKSLHTDFRPPSAGPFEFSSRQIEQLEKQGKDVAAIKAEKAKATGHYYRLMVEHVQQVLADIQNVYPDYDPNQGYQLAGFVWFQGWNDMVDRGTYPDRDQPGGYDQYSELLAHFIRDVRKDLSVPRLPFVIGVMGVGGPVEKYLPGQLRYKGIHQNFRRAMAAPAQLPEFNDNVAAVLTERYWDMELVDLRARDAKIKRQVKTLRAEGTIGRQDERAKLEELRVKEFTERERETLQKGVSNFEFHYLGCAKIMVQIGRGFAEAMAGLAAN
ncbi:MAG: sialate O-acetylesterase [Pirellulales bacterium]|nr:sialate O-acetylesterase [Pirellulales bacterium]